MLNIFQKPAFGIDISDYSVELLALEQLNERLGIRSYARRISVEGIVEDGDIRDKGRLINILGKLLDDVKPKAPSSFRVIASLPESKTFIHVFSLPFDLREREFAQAVRSEARKLIPIDEKEVYFDFLVGDGQGKTRDVFYAACERRIVDEYVQVFEQAGFDLRVLDLESLSIARAVSREISSSDPVCIVDMGARTTNMFVYERGLIRFSGTIFTGGIYLTQGLAHKLNVLPEKAEALKREVGFDSEREEGKVMLILQSLFQEFISEIKEMKGFYEKKTKKKIQKGFLVGGSSLLPGLVDYLNANIGITFTLANPWEHIDTSDVIRQEDSEDILHTRVHPILFANVVGLALRGVGPNPEKAGINLLPRKQESWLDMIRKFNFPELKI